MEKFVGNWGRCCGVQALFGYVPWRGPDGATPVGVAHVVIVLHFVQELGNGPGVSGVASRPFGVGIAFCPGSEVEVDPGVAGVLGGSGCELSLVFVLGMEVGESCWSFCGGPSLEVGLRCWGFQL